MEVLLNKVDLLNYEIEMALFSNSIKLDGEEVSLENRQTILAKRYKDLSKGDKPIAYRGK